MYDGLDMIIAVFLSMTLTTCFIFSIQGLGEKESE